MELCFTYDIVQIAQHRATKNNFTKISIEILLKKSTYPLLTFLLSYFKLYSIKLFGEKRLFPYRVYENN